MRELRALCGARGSCGLTCQTCTIQDMHCELELAIVVAISMARVNAALGRTAANGRACRISSFTGSMRSLSTYSFHSSLFDRMRSKNRFFSVGEENENKISYANIGSLRKTLRGNLPLPKTGLSSTDCGTQFFQFHGAWKKLYAEDFTADEKVKWDADFAKRKEIKTVLDTLIPEFSVRLGGATSIDVTKPGIDKAYGIRKLRDILHISTQEMIYVGDALFPGGNDYPAEQAGVISIPVKNPAETKRVIEAIIACLGDDQQARTFKVD